MLFSINGQNPQMRLIKKAADILRDGGIIIYPTDTVYGLGCDLSNKKGIEKIYEVKRRNRKRSTRLSSKPWNRRSKKTSILFPHRQR